MSQHGFRAAPFARKRAISMGIRDTNLAQLHSMVHFEMRQTHERGMNIISHEFEEESVVISMALFCSPAVTTDAVNRKIGHFETRKKYE